MTCPCCFERTTVTDSRTDGETVYRRRRCDSCGYVFFTTETESDDSGLREIQKNIRMKRNSSK